MDYYDQIYYSLIGELEPPSPGVPNAFAPGSDCDLAYARMIEARNRVAEKLGADDDPDLSQMLTELAAIQYALCRQALSLHKSFRAPPTRLANP